MKEVKTTAATQKGWYYKHNNTKAHHDHWIWIQWLMLDVDSNHRSSETWFPFTWLCMAPRDISLHKHMHFCTHFGNYNNHPPIYHTLTIYKVHNNMQEVLAYKSDCIQKWYRQQLLFVVLDQAPDQAAWWSQCTWQLDLLCSIFFSWSFQHSNPPQWLSLCFPSRHIPGSGFLLFIN